jgi:hypothetical protein
VLLSDDQEKFVKMVGEAVGDWRERLGTVALLAIGVALVLGAVASMVTLRWIRHGGLSAHRHFPRTRDSDQG